MREEGTPTEVNGHDHPGPGHTHLEKKGPTPVNAEALRRLKSIEGQVRGLQRMVEEEKYCIDIVTQISAVRAALNQVGLLVLRRHVEHCVVDAVKSPDTKAGDRIIDELMLVLSRGEL
jgi:DNA-binding FrmR family transcriptional regulator